MAFGCRTGVGVKMGCCCSKWRVDAGEVCSPALSTCVCSVDVRNSEGRRLDSKGPSGARWAGLCALYKYVCSSRMYVVEVCMLFKYVYSNNCISAG